MNPSDALVSEVQKRNRLSWNSAIPTLNSHRGGAGHFFREGGSTLDPEERRLLGDVCGKRVLHMLSHSGLNTLSIARLGAEVTGIDLSDEAIAFACDTAADAGIAARFERADVIDWLERTGAARSRLFDVAFASYGVMVWIADPGRWARGVAGILDRGGRLVLLDFHPMAFCFDRDWRHRFDYSSDGEPVEWEGGVDDYVRAATYKTGYVLDGYDEGVTTFENPHPSVIFRWGISHVITAILDAGLRLALFREYPYSYRDPAEQRVRQHPDGRIYPVEGIPCVPLVYALVATRP
jgi:2-polyprenyl-3-methyl-5-hydroxy-6-metoxy-1,4-benzoquinol methylase